MLSRLSSFINGARINIVRVDAPDSRASSVAEARLSYSSIKACKIVFPGMVEKIVDVRASRFPTLGVSSKPQQTQLPFFIYLRWIRFGIMIGP
jgi:hypothetical protein